MGVWSTVNYASNYDVQDPGNLNIFYAAESERWDAVKTVNITLDAQIDFSGATRVGIWPTAAGAEIQSASYVVGAANSSFNALLNQMSVDHFQFMDPNYSAGYGGADPNALSYPGSGPTYIDTPSGRFEVVAGGGTNSGQWRTSAGLPALLGTGLYRRWGPRLLDLASGPHWNNDKYGNAAAAGQRAYLWSSNPVLDSGQLMLCTVPGTGTWIADNGGTVDMLDSTAAGPATLSDTATAPFDDGDYIYGATFFSEVRALANVMIWTYMGDNVDVGGNNADQFGGSAPPWSGCVTAAQTNFDANVAANAGAGTFTLYTNGFYSAGTSSMSCELVSQSEKLAWSTFSAQNYDLQIWFAASIDTPPSGPYDYIQFDANGFNVANDQWTLVHTVSLTSGSGTYTLGNTAVGVYPNSTVDPSAHTTNGFTFQGFVAREYAAAVGGGFLHSLQLIGKWDRSGGFVYQPSTP